MSMYRQPAVRGWEEMCTLLTSLIVEAEEKTARMINVVNTASLKAHRRASRMLLLTTTTNSNDDVGNTVTR